MGLIFFIIVFFASPGFSGEVNVGNGSLGLECLDADFHETRVRFVDVHEFESMLGFPLPIEKWNKNRSDSDELEWDFLARLALQVFSPLQIWSPNRFEVYLNWLQEFKSKSHFSGSENLFIPHDARYNYLLKNCRQQNEVVLVLQIPRPLRSEPRYIINSNYWNYLLIKDKVGILVHEILYREAIELGQSDSENVRQLTQFLLSRTYKDLNEIEYFNQIKRAGFGADMTE